MKSVFRLAGFVLFTFTVLTCNKANNPPNTILTGAWIVVEFILKDCVDTASDTDEICNGKCDTLTFYSSTFTDNGMFKNSGTYSIKEADLTFTYAGNAPIVTTYLLKNDTLTITFPPLSDAGQTNGCVEIAKAIKLK